MLSFISIVLLLALPSALARRFNIYNRCPTPITVHYSTVPSEVLPVNGSTTKEFGLDYTGFIWSDSNGGGPGGAGTARAGFNERADQYYIVTDPNALNIGMRIAPQRAPQQGYCNPAECLTPNCPLQQVYTCPYGNHDIPYDITFCPTGSFPPYTRAFMIHPNGNPNKCLDVRGGVFANGTPVQIYDCNFTPAQRWIINPGNTKVVLAGTNFCLDAGSNPGNGVGMKIWQCYENLPAQAWYYTNDQRIALAGRGLCLDLTNGQLTNGNQVQTWQCTDFNTNQIWTL